MNDIEWHHDPAASGPRVRAFLPHGEIGAYEDGYWYVRVGNRAQNNSEGKESTQALAKKRALRVYQALT